MEDFIFAPLVLIVGLGIHFVVSRRFTMSEQRLLNFSFGAHVLSAFAQIWIYTYYYGGGDMLNYRDEGIPIAEALRYDFNGIFPETFKLLFQSSDYSLPFHSDYMAGSTGSLLVTASYLFFVLGNSFYAVALTIAVLSYVSKTLVYRALSPEFAPEQRRAVMIAVMLMPTAVFWTCALLKEPVVMIFLGPLFLGLRFFLDGRRVIVALTLLLVGSLGVALFKAYVLLSFAVAATVWVVWARVIRSQGAMAIRPLYLFVAAGLGLGLFTVAQRYLGKAQGDLTQSIASQRRNSGHVEGDSNFSLEGDEQIDANEQTSLWQEFLLAPFALLTALFRPFFFEARKVMQFLNALETTWVLWATIRLFRTVGARALFGQIMASPGLMFCTVFTLILALGTGLSTSNLGALSRYRAPMMPFFTVLLLTLMPRRQSVLDARLQLAATTS